jgi:hypothetical protein
MQEVFRALRLQRRLCRFGNLGIVAAPQRNQHFKQVGLRQRQESACRSQPRWARSPASDDCLDGGVD